MLCESCALIDLASYFEQEIRVERNYRSIEASPEALRLHHQRSLLATLNATFAASYLMQ
jgi:hypothetical protein